ncbi:MASE1 domain-containing protein [Streptomyces sp. CA-250714]|uniref:MASE1 domain-containing protein n=1 Tax=Streptomyces sp. CA-250714 TaxID=3240060 RepID=UPI003D943BF6
MLRLVVLALCYYAGGRLGLVWKVTVEGAVVTPFWPPTGIAVAGLLYFGLRVWPGVALGSLLVLLNMGPLSWTAAGSVAGSTLAPLVACFLLHRVGFREQVDRLRDGVSLVFLGAFLGMLVSATMGCLMLVAGDHLGPHDFWPVWSAWWAGDAVGVLVVTPLLLSLPKLGRPRSWMQAAEALGLGAATTTLAILVTRSPIDLLFLVFPLLVWAALRFQLLGCAVSTTILAVAATGAATERSGVFARQDLITDMITLQALNGTAALTTLLLAAVTAEKRNTHRRIAAACDDLAEMVEVLAPQGRGPRSFPAGGRTGQRQG